MLNQTIPQKCVFISNAASKKMMQDVPSVVWKVCRWLTVSLTRVVVQQRSEGAQMRCAQNIIKICSDAVQLVCSQSLNECDAL